MDSNHARSGVGFLLRAGTGFCGSWPTSKPLSSVPSPSHLCTILQRLWYPPQHAPTPAALSSPFLQPFEALLKGCTIPCQLLLPLPNLDPFQHQGLGGLQLPHSPLQHRGQVLTAERSLSQGHTLPSPRPLPHSVCVCQLHPSSSLGPQFHLPVHYSPPLGQCHWQEFLSSCAETLRVEVEIRGIR